MFWLNIHKASGVPLTKQVYEQIRSRILKGELKKGERLASSRELAINLGVSRNVVIEAYEQLEAEGFVKSLLGSGTYVAEGAYLGELSTSNTDNAGTTFSKNKPHVEIIDFRSGTPALDLFPFKKWGQLLNNNCIYTTASEFGYGKPQGCEKLRQVLSHYLIRTRGVNCSSDQIIVTTGAVQALQFVTSLFLSAGDEIVLEDPSNYDLQRILTYTGASIRPIPVDEQGIVTNLLSQGKIPRFIYVTPSHQFPIGGTLTIQRRIELIKYARETGCYIVEDDYDSEFRYEGPPISSLQGLDPDRVIYIGTFSKIMFPALRIGYMVLPTQFIKRCCSLKRHADFQTPILDQLALADFIEEGLLERHISRMKKVYLKRRQKLIESLETYFKGRHKIMGRSTGLHMAAEFDFLPFTGYCNCLKKAGVRVYPVEIHSIIKGNNLDKLILGYGNLTEEQIGEGIKRMKEAFKQKMKGI